MTLPFYTPLNKNALETRLITILPSNDPLEPVAYTIHNVELKGCRPYVALSYAWGNPAITTPILINGIERHVTTNLEAALQHLRVSEHICKLFWVDAICIN
jgi:hypothetical protein